MSVLWATFIVIVATVAWRVGKVDGYKDCLRNGWTHLSAQYDALNERWAEFFIAHDKWLKSDGEMAVHFREIGRSEALSELIKIENGVIETQGQRFLVKHLV